LQDLKCPPKTNYVAHAVRAFFDEGGRRLYVARVRSPKAGEKPSIVEWQNAFNALATLDCVAVVAAPGSTELGGLADAIQSLLIAHVETIGRYRFAVLDVPKGKTPAEAVACRNGFNSRHAAFYYPWVSAKHPLAKPENPSAPPLITLPPAGFICGIYARSDIERGVWKAPANEVVRGATGFERQITNAEQDILNPAGVNCLRSFERRGHRVWGARTASADPEWKYVNVCRYFIYLEHSIDRGTQWAVFESNGERLWANIRRTVEDFLFNEWRSGALQGDKPENAFLVRCDRSTMTQNDLDNGRLICLIGVAPLQPAEFVIFRIGHKTADAEQ
jgi:uncharacterized protein